MEDQRAVTWLWPLSWSEAQAGLEREVYLTQEPGSLTVALSSPWHRFWLHHILGKSRDCCILVFLAHREGSVG